MQIYGVGGQRLVLKDLFWVTARSSSKANFCKYMDIIKFEKKKGLCLVSQNSS